MLNSGPKPETYFRIKLFLKSDSVEDSVLFSKFLDSFKNESSNYQPGKLYPTNGSQENNCIYLVGEFSNRKKLLKSIFSTKRLKAVFGKTTDLSNFKYRLNTSETTIKLIVAELGNEFHLETYIPKFNGVYIHFKKQSSLDLGRSARVYMNISKGFDYQNIHKVIFWDLKDQRFFQKVKRYLMNIEKSDETIREILLYIKNSSYYDGVLPLTLYDGEQVTSALYRALDDIEGNIIVENDLRK